MHASLANSAQLTNHSSFDATDILEFRRKLKDIEGTPNVTITDIIICAVSRVLRDHRNANAHFLDDKMHLFNNTHIGVAVDTPGGLLVPTIFNANRMTLSELSGTTAGVFDKTKSGTIEPDLLKGATFTISNPRGRCR
jgi:pyruvate dehydrogenase E2 component (dihydrolipoamide acetyltransferase)